MYLQCIDQCMQKIAKKKIKYIIILVIIIALSTEFITLNKSLLSVDKQYIIDILLAVFTSSITLIGIIFVYYSMIGKPSTETLEDNLLKMEEICYKLLEFNKNNKRQLYKDGKNNIGYKNQFEIVKSYFGQYTIEFNNRQKQLAIINNLFYLNIILSILSMIVLLYAVYIAKCINLYTVILTLSIGYILYENCKMNFRIVEINNIFINFPSPDTLLTPNRTLEKYCTDNFAITPYLPLKLFLISTSIAVCKDNDLEVLIKEKVENNNIDTYIIIFSLFKFHIEKIKIEYDKADTLNNQGQSMVDDFDLKFYSLSENDTSGRYYLVPCHNIADAYKKYDSSKDKSEIWITIDMNVDKDKSYKANLNYQYFPGNSSMNYWTYIPMEHYIMYSYSKNTRGLSTGDIAFSNYLS